MRGPRRSLMLAIPLAAMLVASCGETQTVSVERIVEKSVPVEKIVAQSAPMVAADAGLTPGCREDRDKGSPRSKGWW